ncbi:TrbI/VirB10 family protein [Moritella viscosa]|uniref:Conjugation TrbI family protein n=1 Tax=Moritella viscosa TaxID=80854 RepID=A0ABY1HI57_9GAMM|nr:TrbI/VirB10 family protein [Moritella viscosa]SGZ00273.1 Conjugation TrbI family protein [Moritella viscosa]
MSNVNPIVDQNPNNHHPDKKALRKKLVIFGSFILGLILLLMLWALASKGVQSSSSPGASSERTAADKRSTEGVVPELITDNLDRTTAIKPKNDEVDNAPTQPQPPLNTPLIVTPPVLTLDMQRSMAYQQKMRDHRQQQLLSAMTSSTVVQLKGEQNSTEQVTDDALSQLNAQAQMLQERIAQQSSKPTTTVALGNNGSQPVSNQQQKRTFMEEHRQIDYLKHTRETSISPYELKVGTIVPATLISGINSDLAGEVIASVSQNVYDSASGAHLLLPQGSKLYGVYDSKIAYGQSRVLMAWSRINFPDGSTLNLENMAGMDAQGYAGFEDEVDNHYFKIFGNAMLLGMISGTVQGGVSNNSDSNTPSAIADGVTQQFAQTGSSLIQKNLDVQPRNIIRNGYRFNVMVNKDVLLSPYIPRR